MRLVVRPPPPQLEALVESLWWYDDDRSDGSAVRPGSTRERVLPSGRGQLLVNLHADELRTYDAEGRAVVACTRGAAITGPSQASVGIDTGEQRCIVGVSFRPGGTWPLLQIPASALGLRGVDLEHVWGIAGGVVRERLLEAGHLGAGRPGAAADAGPEATIAALGAILREQMTRSPSTDRAVAFAVAAFERGATVREVARSTGLSERTLLRRFESRIGLGPKRYARIRRLQRVLGAIEGGRCTDWARIAQDCGFADQAHLIGDFRELAGMTPTSYRPAVPGMRNHVAL
jgi:AraC-like DNA-binding protein